MSSLRAFEAAARLENFTSAATELNVTQSAVSRQVRQLEEMLGAELFLRERQTVQLNKAGESYALEVREALYKISNATLGIRANQKGGTLNLAILPTFGTRWLAPRLPDFFVKHPGVCLHLSTRSEPFDFQLESMDAAIHFGARQWPGAELEFLKGETVAPVCSPCLRDLHDFKCPEDLLRAPLLHLQSRRQAWEQWFSGAGLKAPSSPGLLVDQFALAAQAAISGLGVALMPVFLVEAELERGDLVVACNTLMQSDSHYYLAWPASRTNYAPLVAFRTWISEVAKNER